MLVIAPYEKMNGPNANLAGAKKPARMPVTF